MHKSGLIHVENLKSKISWPCPFKTDRPSLGMKRPGEERGGLELDLVLFNVLAQVPGLLQVMLSCKQKLEYNKNQQGSLFTEGKRPPGKSWKVKF
jgi:hypothetical protein